MPHIEEETAQCPSSEALQTAEIEESEPIPFPPVTRDHILHCSYDYWFPK